ncbi:MAG: hypothetical protein AAGC57_09120 [Pseudomonadota bacterium]
MTGPDRRLFLLGLGAGALVGCAEPFQKADGRRPPAEGGIGGTGIIGVVTALGSIHVAGQRVLLEQAEISDAFGALSATAVRPGHSVTIEAAVSAAGARARRVQLTYPLVGPLRRGTDLRIMGVKVIPEPGVSVPAKAARVAVSGLWRGDAVMASHLEPASPDHPDLVAGDVSRTTEGSLRIGGLPVLAPSPEIPQEGSFAMAIGRAGQDRLVADRLEPGRFFGAAGPLVRLLVEGYLQPSDEAPGFAISGLGHSFDPAAQLGAVAGQRALFAGPYTGLFSVSHAVLLPDDLAGRRTLLGAGGMPEDHPKALSTR